MAKARKTLGQHGRSGSGSDDRIAAWDRVWGAELESARGPAREACLKWWRTHFAGVEGVQSVLELGAGSAAMAARAAAEAFPHARIVASDFRDGLSCEPPIEYVHNAPIEALGFADASFDLIASQFAFEYARRDVALKEVTRVLRPAGRVLLIMHSDDSHYAGYLLDRIAVLSAGMRIADAIPEGRVLHDMHRISLRRAVARAEQLRERYVADPRWDNVLKDIESLRDVGERVLRTRSPTLTPEEDYLLLNCRDALILVKDQQAASLSQRRFVLFADECRVAGFSSVEHERILCADGGMIGWGVRLSR